MPDPKMHSCVEQVMEQGYDEDSAYAICNAALNSRSGTHLRGLTDRGLQVRAITVEVRASAKDGESRVAGLGIVYDEWVELWPGYKERIRKGAVTHAPIVKSYFNHDPNQVLSTLESTPPLKLAEVDQGLIYDSPIPPTSYGKDLQVNLERGNVKGSSFAFEIPKGGDTWSEDETGVVQRDISKLILYEIGPVTDPAFVQTTAALRSVRQSLEEWRQANPPFARLLRERRQKLAQLT